MHRTTVMLPDDLKNHAARRARELGVSLGELIRLSLGDLLSRDREAAEEDPLYADDAIFEGGAPTDLAGAHDHYLYGEGE